VLTVKVIVALPEPPGGYIIKASDGVMAAKNSFSIVPAETADFFLNSSPQFLKIVQGESGNTTMTLSSKNGFKEPVVFSVGHLAPGVTATFTNTLGTTISKFAGTPGGISEIVAPIEMVPTPGEDMTVTVTIDVDSGAPVGPYDIGLEAGSGTIYRAIPLGLMVVSPGASMVISPMSGPADTDIRLSGTGFTAGETVTVTFAGSSITTVPAAITVAQDGSFTALITAPSMTAGIYPVKVTGATSGTIIDRPFGIKPSAVNSFVLYASPQKVAIPKGGSNTITTKIEPLGSFTSPVTLSLSGLSAITGATANISPATTITPSIATPTTATLTITIPSGAGVGKYPLVITGTSGAITKTRNITVNVVPPVGTPDFGISLAPNTVPISPNSTGNTTVSVTAINGFAGTVDLAVSMSDATASWPSGITYTAGSVTPSAATGMGKQNISFAVADGTQPGSWTFRITGTSGALSHSTDVMVICTPSGTAVTPYASPRLDPTTITSSTPMDMTAPWGDKINIQGIINDSAEASIITPAKVDVAPDALATLPEGATDMLGRITNVESSSPIDGVEWDIGFPFDSANLTAGGFDEENLKIAYLNPETGTWTEVTTTIDTTNKIAYASPTHFSSWTLIATPAPPPSVVVSGFGGGGIGGVGGNTGSTNVVDSTTTDGRFTEDVTAKSIDKMVELYIPKNTVGKNRMGQPLYNVSVKEKASPGAPPADSEIVGLVYDIGPSGATFDPPIDLIFNYDESLVPAGTAEENLVIATWDDGKWVEVAGSTVDVAGKSITVPVSHFSVFTVMAQTSPAAFEVSAIDLTPTIVAAGESVSISATVINTGDLAGSYEVALMVNQITAATKEVNLNGHSSQQVTFTTSQDTVGTYQVSVNGVPGAFIVREVEAKPSEEQPTPSEATEEVQPAQPEEAMPVVSEEQPTVPDEVTAPPEIQPTPSALPSESAVPLQVNLWIIGIAAGGIFIGILIWRLVGRKRVS